MEILWWALKLSSDASGLCFCLPGRQREPGIATAAYIRGRARSVCVAVAALPGDMKPWHWLQPHNRCPSPPSLLAGHMVLTCSFLAGEREVIVAGDVIPFALLVPDHHNAVLTRREEVIGLVGPPVLKLLPKEKSSLPKAEPFPLLLLPSSLLLLLPPRISPAETTGCHHCYFSGWLFLSR